MELVIPPRTPDWHDRHSGPVRADISATREAYEEGLARTPGWSGAALAARNKVVRLFGLHTGDGVEGDLMAALPVRSETPEAYECGLTDKHLTITILTEIKAGKVSMTTSIWFNHWAGRAYLGAVLIPR